MRVPEEKDEKMRQAFLKLLRLSGKNRQLAEAYLDMGRPENPEILKEVESADFLSVVPSFMPDNAKYPDRLRKKSRKEELGRFVKFLVAVGGSTAWRALSGDYIVRVEAVDELLSFCTGEHADDQKAAVRAGMCVFSLYRGQTEGTRKLCMQGRDDPGLFLRAAEFCRDCDGYASTGKRSHARLLLTAMYLHHTAEAGAETVERFWNNMLCALADLAAFESYELKTLQTFARTANRDTPFPQRILSLFHGRRNGINPAWFTACVFLALPHSGKFEILLRMMVAVDCRSMGRNLALDVCMGITEEDWFQARMDETEEMLPILDEAYILWALQAGCGKVTARMAVKSPEGIRKAVSGADSKQYRQLMEIVREANPALYRELQVSEREMLLGKIASELLLRCYSQRDAARRYLLGECAVEELDRCMDEWEDISPDEKRYGKIALLWEMGEKSMYCRAVILEALWKDTAWFSAWPSCPEPDSGTESRDSQDGSLLSSGKQIEGLLRMMEEEKVPLKMQVQALAGICDGIKEKMEKKASVDFCVEVFAGRRQREETGQWMAGMKEAVSQGKGSSRCFGLRVLEKLDSDAWKDSMLSCAEDGSKEVRRLFLEACRTHGEWSSEILALLQAKKPKAREAAVLALGEWGQPAFLEDVKKALGQEKNKKVLSLLQELAEELEMAEAEGGQAQNAMKTEERLAAEIFKGGRKRKTEWLQRVELPEVHRAGGGAASGEYIFAILASYGDMEVPGINPDAQKLAEPLVPEELSLWMRAVYEEWLRTGAEAKKRWVLYAVSIHGGAAMVPVLSRQIGDWAEHSRGAIAAEAVNALALNGSREALHEVDRMAGKCKFRQVRNAAGKALSCAAAQLGISREELEDRLVPDLGFDQKMERHLDYGSRSFTVRLTQGMELEIWGSNGKLFKNLPAPGKQDDAGKAKSAEEELKQLKKQLKAIAATQKPRLEQALRTSRCWQIGKWKELFVRNPAMHPFATGLVWGIYDRGVLQESFRYMEDGSFNTADEREYRLDGISSETAVIGLVHPLELSEQDLAAWKGQLQEYEVTQPFVQLGRPVYRIAQGEAEGTAYMRFEGRELEAVALSVKLLGAGWFRGKVLDGGFFRNFYRSDGRFGAELTFSGTSVGYENGEVTVECLYFYRFKKAAGESPEMFRAEDRCRPEEVEPRYFSEVALQVAGIVGMQ